MPERYGKVSTIKSRYCRWVQGGVLKRILEALAAMAALEWISVDPALSRLIPKPLAPGTKRGA
ncbi:hypothetical protein JCR33_07200 [Acuticoccus sp. 2012]|uniref:Transposase n=1 Tax=Acuticoccus mangrovi TaxID=2796142 RepID=A0A934MGX6_9HYPH|nr:hypothetical protein [Acuticoccus mangrovi]